VNEALIGKEFWFEAKVSRKEGASFVLLEDIVYIGTTKKSANLQYLVGKKFRDDNHCWVKNGKKWTVVTAVNTESPADTVAVCIRFKGKVNKYTRKPVIMVNGLPVYDTENFEDNIEINNIKGIKIINCEKESNDE